MNLVRVLPRDCKGSTRFWKGMETTFGVITKLTCMLYDWLRSDE